MRQSEQQGMLKRNAVALQQKVETESIVKKKHKKPA